MRHLPLLLALMLPGWVGADEVLIDIGKLDESKLPAQGVRVARRDALLSITATESRPYPGITLRAPTGRWDLSKFARLEVDVTNPGRSTPITASLRVDNPGADGRSNCLTGSATIPPAKTVTLTVLLDRPLKQSVKLFGMRGYPAATTRNSPTIDPANITQLIIFAPGLKPDYAFWVTNIRAAGTYTLPDGKDFLPLVDTFGQYMHADWPGKVHSLQELRQRIADEQKEMASLRSPEDWDQYGGWKDGPALKATGFFRVEKDKGKWWLVDPEGRLFFSHGIDCVRMLDATPIDDRDNWFADFPGNNPQLREFINPGAYALKGYYAGKSPRCFSFAGANLKRKYGDNWRAAAAQTAHRRLRSWGMNTIANWSDSAVYRLRKTPYTANVGFRGRLLEGSSGYWGKFRDVFDPQFKEAVRNAMAREKGNSAGDPWCLGYFVDNEISWGNDGISLAVAALQSPPDQPAKLAFISDLKAKYASIEKLNDAWGTKHESWDALLASRAAPDAKKAAADLAAFYTRTAETYFRTIRDAVKEVAPNQLYLGCRFAWANPRCAAAAARYCDVVSYNLYRRSVADFRMPGGEDVPLIIGEFHFGALDRGMFHTGLVKTTSQSERAATYVEYVRGALRHPQFVGTHWFQYQDEPTTGRVLDEENYQIGFIDIADTPYHETIDASREVGYGMYRYRMEN